MNSSISKDSIKDSIRKEMSQKRRGLDRLKKCNYDKIISGKLENLSEWKESNRILVYISHTYEVATIELIKSNLNNKKFVIPKSNKKDYSLTLHEFSSFEDLVKGNYNILEPRNGSKIISPDLIELAIIPGVAFDLKGNRIGYGKAYYDSLLPNLNCLKIGLAYNLQIVDNIPAQKHDAPIDRLITEKDIYNFKT